ncbi:ATP-binding cassette domain-containing protein [Streptomyces sp. ME03-5684b]|uniref:ABC transporter ATP-binding protein C-terminal domain-containing protein n=1 Tax=Streptomyces sp. ME03-5684b TaxID=3028681 RepID=UPI0029BA1019|nr:ATP-binding cassette domain-containing protein [Streptomyces sp. ME03-5684b]MDX3319660.1 ATP-binding cassette domain-containing protein [Streptomyces sp. ME03-5684b]
MSPYAHLAAGSLAYGLQRRVEIARALAGDPAVLLLDEPLAGLARAESTGLTRLFTEIAAEGVTVLLVEHDVAGVFAVSDRVLVLDRGRLLADGTPERVAADPAVRTAYLGDEL